MYLVNKKLKVLKVPDKTLKAVMFLSYSETHKHETVITYFAFTPIYTTTFYLRSQRVAMGNASCCHGGNKSRRARVVGVSGESL